MSSVTFAANLQPAPACYPSDVNQLLTLIATKGLSGTVPDNAGGGIYVGSVAPSSSLTNKVWFKTDAAARPLGVFMFYNGNWRKVYSGSIGDVKMFGGNPSGRFDGTGRGVVGSDEDGWALCNGSNGTPNLVNRFVVGSYGWDGSGWLTSVDGVARYTGGAGTFVIQATNLPAMQTPTYGVLTGTGGGSAYAFIAAENGVFQNYWRLRDGAGNVVGGSVPINNCPPYYALAYAMFIGYA